MSATKTAEYLSEIGAKRSLSKKRVSRETVNKYFRAFGDYLYKNLPAPLDKWKKFYSIMSFQALYLEDVSDYQVTRNVIEKLNGWVEMSIVAVLEEISKVNNGLSKERQNAHFAHAVYIHDMRIRARKEGNEDYAPIHFLQMLEEEPLNLKDYQDAT